VGAVAAAALAGWNHSGVRAASADTAYLPRPKGTVTFAKDVAPILYKSCTPCHRSGEVAPFTLGGYEDARKRAAQIAAVTESRVMPPWKADSHGEFHDERLLSANEIGLLKQWAAEGAKEGSKAAAPPAPSFPAGWSLGQPDATLTPTEDYTLAADGRDVYRCYVLPNPNDADRFLSAIEFKPGNRAVVHHVIAYLDTTGQARKLDAGEPGPGYSAGGGGIGFPPSGFLGGWAPGNYPRRLPEGVGIPWPKGADIVLQVHYHKSGKPEADRTKIGLYYTRGTVDKKLYTLPLMQPGLFIPPGKADYSATAQLPVVFDASLLTILPHMHLLGTSIAVSATLPDGTTKPLIRIPHWDFNWQNTYAYREPLKLPKGTQLHLTAYYDNSTGNVRNPNSPPRMVTWGEQTTDEMCLAFLGFTVDSEHLTKGVEANVPSFGNGGRRGLLRRILQSSR
jgi:hypothetical protein